MNSRKNLGIRLAVFVFMPALVLAIPAMAVTRYVPSPYPTIQLAIDASAVTGDEIEVAPGIHVGAINFNGKAITLRSTDPNDPSVVGNTVIHGGMASSAVTCNHGEGPDTVLAGFTIMLGYAVSGGGMLNVSSSPTVKNCTFTSNYATDFGGGMYNMNSSPTVINCTFSSNSGGTIGGGGMCNWAYSNPTVSNCIFSSNSAASGGGMYNYNSNPTVNNCEFSGNTAYGSGTYDGGGGMYNNQSSPTVAGCTFSENEANGNADYDGGGGMYNLISSPTVTYCAFNNNESNGGGNDDGGGMYNYQGSPAVRWCTFNGNTADFGGGMYNNHESGPTVTNCTFSDNSAGEHGGGMYCHDSSPTVTNCTFTGNEAGQDGGGIGNDAYNNPSNPNVTNCLFFDNTAGDVGGGICNAYGDPNVTNCTFSGNSATDSGGAIRCYRGNAVVRNCVLWGNTAPTDDEISVYAGNTLVEYCDIQGFLWPATGNISEEPDFVDAAGGDFRLSSSESPCVDAGNTIAVPADTTDLDGDGDTSEPTPLDLNGDPRIVDGDSDGDCKVDMGAFEYGELRVHNLTQDTSYIGIQNAINDANNGDEIEVGPGRYNEAIDFKGKAITLRSNDPNDPEIVAATIIDGKGSNHVVMCLNGEGPDTILEGFTITGGNADGGGAAAYGGGMYCYTSSPTVTNCTFSSNESVGFGAGMYNYGGSPTVTNCTFSENTSSSDAGGMWNGNSSSTIMNCTFRGNIGGNGGGMFNQGGSLTVKKCMFMNNDASGSGGGMRNYDSSPTVTNCIFSGNSAASGGGMINDGNSSNSKVTNCIFTGNQAASYGGGIYNSGSSPTVTNCSFKGNAASSGGGGMYNNTGSNPTVTNCILWDDTPDEIVDNSSTSTVTYSDVEGTWFGAGNINAAPCFVDPGEGDFRLAYNSPCVDAGDNDAPYLPTTDLAGNDRVMDGDGDGNSVVDMGVCELEPPITFDVGVGTLTVTIDPNEAVAAGAKWKVDVGDQWYNSGDVITLSPGYYQVEVNDLSAWYEPEKLAVGYDTADSNEVPQQSLWVRVIGDMNATVIAEYKPLPVFAIGEIPPRDVPHGRTLEFFVDANWLGDDVLYSLTMTSDPNYPEPEGPILIDPVSGLFTYEPNDANDWAPFTLIFTAAFGVDVNEQTVKITPIPDLPPEYTIFNEPVQDWPDPCDHIFVNEILSDSNEYLNGADRQVRSVTVAGKLIEVADVPDNPVYVYSGNLDINDLTIYAETLVISDPLHLPQTRVTIYARELIFEGETADINTTPIDPREGDGTPLDGLTGGDIRLYIESYDPGPVSNWRFKTSGTGGFNWGRRGYAGDVTCTLDTHEPLAWLSPYALKMVIAHAKDAYLYRFTAETHDILSEYAGLLTAYRAMPEWNELDGDWQYEFGQMHQEIITLVHRLENSLDYFGNPPGWTPMLSFEVWKAAYEDEIERGIRVLYLSYWLQHIADDAQAKADALAEGRSKLWEETLQFKEDYKAVADIIETLKTSASNIVNTVGGCDEAGCSGLMGELKNKEAELLERADRIVEDRNKVPWWKAGLKAIATSYKATFEGAIKGIKGGKIGIIAGGVYGRITGTYQGVQDLLASQEPWESATAVTTVADEFDGISTDFGQAYDGCFQVYDDIEDLSDIEGGAEGYLSALKGSTSQIADGLYDVKEALMATSLDNEEVQTELEKLKATDPTFNRLVDKAVELMVQKEAFNRQLAAFMQKVSTLSNGITNNILAIDSMNRQVSLQNRVFDRRALMYVKDMELRARARLLKYHYYMAKAYEYRTLKRYGWPLDIQDVFDSIVTMAQGASSGILSGTDYDTIKAVYDELFSDIRDHILELYSYEQEKEIDLLYGITTLDMPEQIAQLNAGQTATIDLLDLIDPERENVRIVDMSVDDVILTSDPPYPAQGNCQLSYVAVKMEHSGVCSLQKGKDRYRFSYPETENGIRWESDCYVRGDIEDSTQSYASESMLRALLPDLSDVQVMFYSRPALWADIGVYRNVTLTPTCSDVDIESLTLRIKYDYTSRNIGYVTLHVGTFPGELRPYFILDKADKSEDRRQDGIGDFYRTYNPGTSVTVTAPERYGDYEFRWWYCEGGSSPFYSYDRELEVDWMTDNVLYTIEAEYEYVGPLCAGDVNADLNVDLRDFSSLAAAWLTKLGDKRWDKYCDISIPADYVIDEFDLKVLCENWLATP